MPGLEFRSVFRGEVQSNRTVSDNSIALMGADPLALALGLGLTTKQKWDIAGPTYEVLDP